jgi:hypothetical protein
MGLEHAEPGPEREVRADRGPHGTDDRDEQLGSRLHRAAPSVLPVVRRRRRERVQQVAVPTVQLDPVEAGGHAPPGGLDEAVDHPGQVLVRRLLHRVRGRGRREGRHHAGRLLLREHPRERVGRGRPLARGHEERPALGDVEERVGAAVHQLRGDRRAVAMGVVGEAPQPGQVGVLGGGDLPPVEGAEREGSGHRPDDQQPCATAGAGLEPGRLAVADHAVAVAEVHAHRAHRDAVAEAQRPELHR